MKKKKIEKKNLRKSLGAQLNRYEWKSSMLLSITSRIETHAHTYISIDKDKKKHTHERDSIFGFACQIHKGIANQTY